MPEYTYRSLEPYSEVADDGETVIERRKHIGGVTQTEWRSIVWNVWYATLWLPLFGWGLMLASSVGWALYWNEPRVVGWAVTYGLLFIPFGVPATALIGLFAVPLLVCLFVVVERSLRITVSPVLAGAFAGGAIVGGVVTWFLMARIFYSPDWQSITSALVVAASATAVGQYGGAMGGWKALREERRKNLIASLKDENQPPEIEPQEPATRTFRFGIGQMMILSVWLAAGLTILKLAGALTPQFAVVAGAWLVIHVSFLLLGWRLWPSYIAWRTSGELDEDD